MKSTVDFVEMRFRKNQVEHESYRIARESVFGWKTEKMFNKDAVFEDLNLDDDSPWWCKKDLSKEKKWEKLKAADRQVKFQLANVKKFQSKNSPFSNKFNQNSGQGQPYQNSPRTFPGRKCFLCNGKKI